MTDNTEEISKEELDALLRRMEEAIEHGLALSSDDLILLMNAIQTLTSVQTELQNNNVTLHKLKKLLGIVTSSEKRNTGTGGTRKKPKGKKKPPRKNAKPKVVVCNHKDLKKGDQCPNPNCGGKGKVYPFRVKISTRVSGHSPYEEIEYHRERLRCNLCHTVFTAPLPDDVLFEGPDGQMYEYPARSLMAMDKFYSGEGYNHQENLTSMLGRRVSSSTAFDQCENLANDATPIFNQIKRDAAKAPNLLGDDTPHRILDKEPEVRPNRNGKGKRLRTGIYTSCLIANTANNEEIVLMETSLGHFGEAVDNVLKLRPSELPPPILMSDALSSNKPLVCEVVQSLCNTHGNRQFKDIEHIYPEVTPIIDDYGKIWVFNGHTKEQNMTDQQRMEYHRKHSLPIMQKILRWCQEKLQDKTFEENSSLGKAVHYFINHFDGLCRFCWIPGVLIDNNRTEETLKIAIRGRKTYMFFKTDIGAGVANILTSLIATAWRAGINVFEYLNDIQRYNDQVRASPELWVPYRYEATIKAIRDAKLAA